jgi:hypothetical protein
MLTTYEESEWDWWAAGSTGTPPGWEDTRLELDWLDVSDLIPDPTLGSALWDRTDFLTARGMAYSSFVFKCDISPGEEQVRLEWLVWAKDQTPKSLFTSMSRFEELFRRAIELVGEIDAAHSASHEQFYRAIQLYRGIQPEFDFAALHASAVGRVREKISLPTILRNLPEWITDLVLEIASLTFPIPVLIGIREAPRSQIALVAEYNPKGPRIWLSFGELAVHYVHHASTR